MPPHHQHHRQRPPQWPGTARGQPDAPLPPRPSHPSTTSHGHSRPGSKPQSHGTGAAVHWGGRPFGGRGRAQPHNGEDEGARAWWDVEREGAADGTGSGQSAMGAGRTTSFGSTQPRADDDRDRRRGELGAASGPRWTRRPLEPLPAAVPGLPARPPTPLRLRPASQVTDAFAHVPISLATSRAIVGSSTQHTHSRLNEALPLHWRAAQPAQESPTRSRFVPYATTAGPAPPEAPAALAGGTTNQSSSRRVQPDWSKTASPGHGLPRRPRWQSHRAPAAAAAPESVAPRTTLPAPRAARASGRPSLERRFLPLKPSAAQPSSQRSARPRDAPAPSSSVRSGPTRGQAGDVNSQSGRQARPFDEAPRPAASLSAQAAAPFSSVPAVASASSVPALAPAPLPTPPFSSPPPTADPPRHPSRLSSPSDPNPPWLAAALYGPTYQQVQQWTDEQRAADEAGRLPGGGGVRGGRSKRASGAQEAEEARRGRRRRVERESGEDEWDEEGVVWLDLQGWEAQWGERTERWPRGAAQPDQAMAHR
ncbi:hypothetical protein DMC30DRAFT_129250 [Rhodotorula diobovata]|uniref:Uncharacterized protein n=1 Tax=Rhodotorula diobovata TaxID=5288 RepID=A0A5C5G266_9BASI|nr:hypothetical protein DMC30DRAFT_129250 [Rhodotorula diobovata]